MIQSLTLSLLIFLCAASAFSAAPATTPSTDLYFKTSSDQVEEHTFRSGQTATHIYLDSIKDPYLFFAFPAGNSGVGLWFKSPDEKALLKVVGNPEAVHDGGGLNGALIHVTTGTRNLKVDDSVLGSMRFLRDRELGAQINPEVVTKNIKIEKGHLFFRRLSLNGLIQYRMELEPSGDTKVVQTGAFYSLQSPTEVKFVLKGLTGEKPVTPMAPEDVFLPDAIAKMNPEKLKAFSFLLYKEKLMAGSPRYLSKFGRDSIYTLHALMDAMKPQAIENLLTATLSSLNPATGEVSHEQSEGDYASFHRMIHNEPYLGISTPLEDYKMIDDNPAFVIVLADYMKKYPSRVKAFLNQTDERKILKRTLVKAVFQLVRNTTAAFVTQPTYQNLVGLQPNEKVGDWRDSENGLGGGNYPFDVNVALEPGALKALADLAADPKSEFADPIEAAYYESAFQKWNTQALSLFMVHIPQKQVVELGSTYWKSLGLDAKDLPAAPAGDLDFPALSIGKDGVTVPIMNSDDSLVMAFGDPSEAYLKSACARLQTSFPYGLATPVGILVANPVFASPEWQKKFDETKYHGRVSWTMQEDLLLSGLRRQLQRSDLSSDTRTSLATTWNSINKIADSKALMGGNEVFALVYSKGSYAAVPFAGDAKSNSNQLWSHLRLAEPPIQ